MITMQVFVYTVISQPSFYSSTQFFEIQLTQWLSCCLSFSLMKKLLLARFSPVYIMAQINHGRYLTMLLLAMFDVVIQLYIFDVLQVLIDICVRLLSKER